MQILDDIIDREREARVALKQNPMRVEEKRLKPFLIAGIRFNGKYPEIGRYFGRLADRMRENISGVPMGLYYDGEYKEENADIEACFPIQSEKTVPGIRTRELQGGRCFSLLHHGAYENIGNAYARLLTHLKSEGAALRLPFRESYIKGPGLIIKGNPENFLTEIQIMVA